MDARFSTVNIATGHFDVYWDGTKTDWRIVNGSLGMGGRDTRNVYGIVKGDFIRWIGPLVTCKKTLAFTLRKQADGGAR